jgi:hypothetical protein
LVNEKIFTPASSADSTPPLVKSRDAHSWPEFRFVFWLWRFRTRNAGFHEQGLELQSVVPNPAIAGTTSAVLLQDFPALKILKFLRSRKDFFNRFVLP